MSEEKDVRINLAVPPQAKYIMNQVATSEDKKLNKYIPEVAYNKAIENLRIAGALDYYIKRYERISGTRFDPAIYGSNAVLSIEEVGEANSNDRPTDQTIDPLVKKVKKQG